MYAIREITAGAQWTDPIKLAGFYNYSVQGEFEATVTIQRSFDEGETWEDMDSFTEPISSVGYEAVQPYRDNFWKKPSVDYRIGVKEGAFTSGPVRVRIGVV